MSLDESVFCTDLMSLAALGIYPVDRDRNSTFDQSRGPSHFALPDLRRHRCALVAIRLREVRNAPTGFHKATGQLGNRASRLRGWDGAEFAVENGVQFAHCGGQAASELERGDLR